MNLNEIQYSNIFFRENIKFLTNENGIKKNKLAEELGISEPNLSRLCRQDNKQQPSIELLSKISKRFSITIDELINCSIKERREKENIIEERNDIKFFNKLIEETNENEIVWESYQLKNKEEIYDEIIKTNYENLNEYYFFDRIDRAIEVELINIFHAYIGKYNSDKSDLKLCIIEIPKMDGIEKNIYVSYIKEENSKVIKIGESDELLDRDLTLKLEELYKSVDYYINFGKERFEKDRIFTKYLEVGEMPF